ncbi:septation ring formation regulator EzrA [Terrilactibacillus sp. S3-3]|nr:septation ring formation regulator EzrA [Terrilactibacillus sp. S3-3]
MLYAVVGIIVLFAVAVIYSTWMRKKIYSQIDRMESWKNDIMTRPVAEEMARMKELKMVGEAEKKFDKWRSDWDDIVAAKLPAIEKELFEAEELADKYRFKKASQGLKQLENALSQIENQIDGLLKDLNEVVESEHQNRKDIISIKEDYHQIKKSLITKRSQFKRTFLNLENAKKNIDEQFKVYDSETNQGNYIKARKILLETKQQIDALKQEIEQIPRLYKDLHHVIPEQLKELRQGHQEMVEQGYVLEHLQVEEQIAEMEKQLFVLEQAVERLELDDAAESIQAMHDQLDWIYAQMEKEVLSRKQLHEVAPAIEQNLQAVGKNSEGTG